MQRLVTKFQSPVLLTLIFSVAVIFCFFFLGVDVVAAQETSFDQFAQASTLPTDNIAVIIARVIRVALTLVGIVFVCLIIYAGFLYLLARGESEQIAKAKRIFQQSIIGVFIIFSAYSITTFILNRLLDATLSGSSSSSADVYSEPLSGALGGGILDDHYPERDARDIPRNTRIFVSFKEPINPSSMIEGFDQDQNSTDLNTESVVIYPTEEGPSAALTSEEVVVTYDELFEQFVFDPVEYLGSADQDTNYTVVLTTNIEQQTGEAAFSGTYASGYSWTFEISTELDLTPPYIVSVVPLADSTEPRNVTIELTFNEPMDPVASTGSYLLDESEFFTNIEVLDQNGANVQGTFEISNGYRSLSFTTIDACGEDPCGDTIYCLPTNQRIDAIAKAASINEQEAPQAQPVGATFDGLVDAASNSLDGNNDGQACGSSIDSIDCTDGEADDHYRWGFTTSDDVEDTVPQIVSEGLIPGIEEDEISQTNDVQITFNTTLKSSTLNTSSVSLWPDPYYEFWYAVRKTNSDTDTQTTVMIEHPTFVSTDQGGWDYWPVMTNDIKSTYQICMYPAIGPGANCTQADRDSGKPYCCNGIASAQACQTDTQRQSAAGESLPDNSETEVSP